MHQNGLITVATAKLANKTSHIFLQLLRDKAALCGALSRNVGDRNEAYERTKRILNNTNMANP